VRLEIDETRGGKWWCVGRAMIGMDPYNIYVTRKSRQS